MKTLDEVIKAYEYCNHDDRCEDCPYNGIACTLERDTDALHYLKTIETTENLYHDAVNELSKWKDEDWKDRHLPLTWDELKQMEGKPIWVEDNIDDPEDLTKYWAIYRRIEKDQETEYALLSDFYYDKAQYGESWQVYRKEHHDDN